MFGCWQQFERWMVNELTKQIQMFIFWISFATSSTVAYHLLTRNSTCCFAGPSPLPFVILSRLRTRHCRVSAFEILSISVESVAKAAVGYLSPVGRSRARLMRSQADVFELAMGRKVVLRMFFHISFYVLPHCSFGIFGPTGLTKSPVSPWRLASGSPLQYPPPPHPHPEGHQHLPALLLVLGFSKKKQINIIPTSTEQVLSGAF